MRNADLSALFLIVVLGFAGCGSDEGESPTNSGGTQGGSAQSGGSGGALGGSSSGGSKATGGSAGLGSGGAGTGGSAGTNSGTGGSAAGSGGSTAGSGGTTGGAGGSGAETFACGPLSCQTGEELCHRTLPALPGGNEQRSCDPFPGDCAARDCSCFCEEGAVPPCPTPESCTCSGEGAQIQVVCAGA